MGMIRRMAQPGVVVTLHAARPGSPNNALVKSERLSLTSFSEGSDFLVNRERIDMNVVSVGTIRYAAAWIENQLEGIGKLEKTERITASDLVYFPRGDLRLKREERRS